MTMTLEEQHCARKLNNSVTKISCKDNWIHIPQWTFAGWPYKRLRDGCSRVFNIIYDHWMEHGDNISLTDISETSFALYGTRLRKSTIRETKKRLYMYGYLYMYNDKNRVKPSRAGIVSAIWQGKLKKPRRIDKYIAKQNPIYIRKHFSLFTHKDRIYKFVGFNEEKVKIKKAQV